MKISVAAAVVLGMGGYVTQPYVQEWALIRNACGGGLPQDTVKQLTPEDSLLESAESRTMEGLGTYTCEVTLAGGEADGHRFVRVTAYTRRDDQDREFMSVFRENGFNRQSPLPEALPGFVDAYGDVRVVVPCPGLTADSDGRKRKLLVNVHLGESTLTGVPGAAHRMAVALTGMASDELGCGAEPLKAPEREVPLPDPSDDPEKVPLAEAAGTPCEWVTEVGLPADEGWRVSVEANSASPSGRCDLSSAEDSEDTQEPSRLVSAFWYGDWSNRLTADENHGVPRSMTATAQCQGEAANYALSGTESIPGVDAAAEQRMLKLFAQDEVRRRNCTGLRFHF
ncbi:hypothetical protein [Streptomyces sp. SM10]|uniref:hypothetical protein n=1 Tax=Streptomyces sp. SM10 TaxID=565556 RepID=UPI0011B0A779|nr:hypothetical protein [Streptomyces sp. SM10]